MIGTYYRLSLADEDVGADKAESVASELAARRTAMDAATQNAGMWTMVIPAHPQAVLRSRG